jgi:membrane-associated protease RseP (regulator of RpoE activity)
MQNYHSVSLAEPDPIKQITAALGEELAGLFLVIDVSSQSRGQIITFEGRLLSDSESSYDEIRRRFHPHGYTPMLRREKDRDIVLAMEGLVDQAKKSNPLINILLLFLTILTTLSAGAQLELGTNLPDAIINGNRYEVGQVILAGLPFSITLLGILGVHELGHYLAARWYHIQATLPYFIPIPLGLGTLGALINIKSPMRNRRVLFDIGLAGPYAGLLVAVPLFIIGLLRSSIHYVPLGLARIPLESLGLSVFVRTAVAQFTDIPAGYTIEVDPILFAAWWGIFVTGINLLPVGQLDGGHAAYALIGRYAHGLALLTFLGLIVVGSLQQQPAWFIWAFFIMLGGLKHPQPMNDIVDVGPIRKGIGIMTIILFIVIFIPRPF